MDDFIACWTPRDSIDEQGGPYRFGPVVCTRGFSSFDEADAYVSEKSHLIEKDLLLHEFTSLERSWSFTPDWFVRERLNWKHHERIYSNRLIIAHK